MTRASWPPVVWLIQADRRARAALAVRLRADGMEVIEYPTAELALEALSRGKEAAILVTDPARGRLTVREFAEQAKVAAPRLEMIFTGASSAEAAPSGGIHVLTRPFEADDLVGLVRGVAANLAPLGAPRLRDGQAKAAAPRRRIAISS